MKTIKNLICLAFALLAFACFALAPQARATCQDACLTGFNTVQGDDGFNLLTTGDGNTGLGWRVLFSVGAGSFNTGVGAGALVLNTASNNTATGAAALLLNTTGTENTATGTAALEFNGIASNNTANGAFALFNNDSSGNGSATDNTAVGFDALNANVDGSDNTAVGSQALLSNNNADGNTGVGDRALELTTDGGFNTAIGDVAMGNNVTGNTNTVVGSVAGINLVNGFFNTYVGDLVGVGAPDENSVIRIADLSSGFAMNACFIGGIFGNLTPGVPVFINASGQLSTAASSARFKDEIKPMEKASEAIFALKPVTFRYKKEFDRQGVPQFGLIAEEVEKVNPDLVYHDGQGEVYSVRYEAVNAMLLNEFLKAHRRMEEQEATMTKQQKQIDALTAGLQKVSAQLELNKAAPQTVLNNR
jgi:hypothetical protein